MQNRIQVAPLEAHLGYWLRFVSNHVSHGFALKVEDRGVTVAEWVILRELYGRSASPSALAARLGMTRGAVSKLADRLAAKDLLVRTTEKNDRRCQALSLTKPGRALVPELAALADANDHEFFGHLEPAERTALVLALQDIARRLDLRAVPLA